MKRLLLVIGFLILFSAEILRVYFIMPFPGSQHANTIDLAYFIDRNIWIIRFIGVLFIVIPLYRVFTKNRFWPKILLSAVLVLYAGIFFLFNFKFLAEKMFYQPTNKNLVTPADNKVNLKKLVIGIAENGNAKAYPIEIIGYHHQVQDTIAGKPIIVTYCTVCRTGRVYSPVINEKTENFRLVGMDHFNAMFEDNTTKSWWMQATGVAVAGQLKGSALTQLPSQQMTLAAWLREYPQSKILQEDSVFKEQYKDLEGFDNGTIESSLEKRDSLSWQMKSWVVGVATTGYAKAYDWNELVNKKLIQDSLPNLPLILWLEQDTASFHVWNRNLDGKTLHFTRSSNNLQDTNTNSFWNDNGVCIQGSLIGLQLKPVQASQEFWHSWQTFHPDTKKYSP